MTIILRFTLESWLKLEKIGTKTRKKEEKKKENWRKEKDKARNKNGPDLGKENRGREGKKNKKREREHIRFGPFEGLYRTSGNSMIRLRSKTMTLDLNALAHIPPEIGQESAMEVHGKAA